MSEYIVDALWMAEYERGIESLLGIELEYDDYDNPTPPLPRRNIIVRCKDCKRFAVDQSDHDYRSGWWCHRWNTDMVRPDGFCAWGDRK